ncbi:metal-sulfur cluster assembly factor [Candidatus Shapirobacteria bacterium]|nr:metal-sulfur cluster assembly factor [Candidatus Shapirobacteria bacterium]
MIDKKEIYQALEEVLDPELGISIVDLGLIYQLQVTEGKRGARVKILMTLTAPGCPFMSNLADEVKEKVASLEGVEEAAVNLTFDPPWSPEKMTAAGKKKLGWE